MSSGASRRGQRGANGVSDNNTKDNNRRQPEPCAERGHGAASDGGPWRIEQRSGAVVSNGSSQSVHNRGCDRRGRAAAWVSRGGLAGRFLLSSAGLGAGWRGRRGGEGDDGGVGGGDGELGGGARGGKGGRRRTATRAR